MAADQTLAASSRSAVLGWGLPGESTPAITLDAAEAGLLLSWAADHRLGGLLWAAHEGGAINLPADEVKLARDLLLGELRTMLRVVATAAQVTETLTAAGVRSRLLKGLASGHLDYPDPAWRNSADADLLIGRSDLPKALQVLADAGVIRPLPGLAPWWEQRFARTVELRNPVGVEVDLHVALSVGWFGVKLDHDRLLALPPSEFTLGGVPVAALPGPARLLSTCYSIVLSRGQQDRLLRDLAQQLLVSNCGWDEALDLARTGDGDAVLHAALRRATRAIPALANHPAAMSATPARSRQAAAALHLASRGEQEGWAADARSTSLALTWTQRVLFLAGLALPPRASRAGRGRSIGRHLRRGARLISASARHASDGGAMG